jgi:branched-subunit amino acid transport protein
MSLALIAGIALLTYASRALALVFMPDPPPRMKATLDRIPAPLFAALAVTSLIDDGQLANPTMLTAAAFGLAAAPTRSLLWVLLAGLTGYVVGTAIFG